MWRRPMTFYAHRRDWVNQVLVCSRKAPSAKIRKGKFDIQLRSFFQHRATARGHYVFISRKVIYQVCILPMFLFHNFIAIYDRENKISRTKKKKLFPILVFATLIPVHVPCGEIENRARNERNKKINLSAHLRFEWYELWNLIKQIWIPLGARMEERGREVARSDNN